MRTNVALAGNTFRLFDVAGLPNRWHLARQCRHACRTADSRRPQSRCNERGQRPVTGFQCLPETVFAQSGLFRAKPKAGATELLNVLQGRNEAESKAWYEAVKGYGLEGWAFAGAHQNSFSLLLNRLRDMRNDGLLQTAKWIHILGISTPSIAYLFNALQRCVTDINPDLQITFDTAGPFISAAKFQAMMAHRLDKDGWAFAAPASMPNEGSPSDHRTLNELAWEMAQRRPKAKRGNSVSQNEHTFMRSPRQRRLVH